MPHVVLTNTFDAAGDRTSLSATIAGVKDFLNNYTLDADQRLTTVTQQGQNGGNIVSPKEIDYAYNALGQFTSVAAYNTLTGPRTDVLTGAYSYDSANRLTGLAYTSNVGATTIDTFGWGYDAANNVTSFSSIDGTASYGYDPTNQLTSATYTTASGGHQPANESYSFDKNGNRTNTGYSTGSANLMTSDGTFNYSHDADGNQTVRTRISSSYAADYRTTYSWDYRNRLTDVQFFDNNSVLTKHVHYVYDVFDHLIATEADTTGGGSYNQIAHYVLDVSPETPLAGVPGTALAQPAFVFDGNGNLTGRNLVALDPAGVDAVLAQGTVIALNQADTVTWMADDNLGTPRDEVSNTGALANHSVFSSFGQDVYDSAPSVAHWAGFAGGHVDPNTGLVNDYHRWYDPATGRWISNDPAGFRARDANLTRYVGNGPTLSSDPTGLINPLNFDPSYLTPDQLEVLALAGGDPEMEQAIFELFAIIDTTSVGYWEAVFEGPCTAWTNNFVGNCLVEYPSGQSGISVAQYTYNYNGWGWPLWTVHSFVQVTINGSTFFVDNGTYGGSDGIFSVIPSDLSPMPGAPSIPEPSGGSFGGGYSGGGGATGSW